MIAAIKRLGGTLIYVPDNLDGVYVDNVGTSPVTAIADLIGLITDKLYGGTLGPELVTSGSFSSGSAGWSTPPGWSVSGGVCTASNTVASMKQIDTPYTAGRAYRVEFDWTHVGGTLYVRVGTGTATTFTTSGRKSVVLTASNSSGVEAYGGAVSGAIDNISVREVLGRHATQSAVASKPSLRQVNGRNVIRFDGNNDFLQTGITTGNEGWVCAGVSLASGAPENQSIFYSGADADSIPGSWLAVSGGSLRLSVGNGAARNTILSATVPVGVPKVLEGGWDASLIRAALDGTETTLSKTVNCTTSRTFRVGLTDANWAFGGSVHAIVYIAVQPDPADRALIRNGIAALQGREL